MNKNTNNNTNNNYDQLQNKERGASQLVLVGVITLVVLLIAGYFLFGGKVPFISPTATPVPSAKVLPTPNYSQVAVTNSATVTINGKTFTPETIQVKKGSVVTWINKGSKDVEVILVGILDKTSDNTTGELNTDPLSTNGSFNYTFDKVGTYIYYDKSNPSTKGTVIVVE